MRGSLHWLERPILGERLGGEGEVVRALHRRSERRIIEPRVREPRPVREVRSRPVRRKVPVGPYAPQLIRLVRHPYAQAVARGRRVRFVQAREALPERAPSPRISEVTRRDLGFGAPAFGLPRPRFGARRWAREIL